MSLYWKLVAAYILSLAGLPTGSAQDIAVKDAWIAEGPPGARVLAAFMRIDNRSAESLALTEASSPQVERIEMHRTVFSEGMARMQHQETLTIAPQSSLKLAPGGYHLMLIGPNGLHSGDVVPIILTFDDGSQITAMAEVRKRSGTMTDDSHHHP